MWTEEKQHRMDELRAKKFAGTLAAEEQQELEKFFAELEAEEAELLRPAMDRLDTEIKARRKELAILQAEKAAREILLVKRAALLARTQELVAQIQAEDRALQAEYERALSQAAVD